MYAGSILNSPLLLAPLPTFLALFLLIFSALFTLEVVPRTSVSTRFRGPIVQLHIPNNTLYTGTEKIDGVQCDHWQVPGEEETYDLWVQSSNVNNPIRLKETSFKGDYVIIDINQLVPGKPQAGIFKIPSFCKTN